MLIFIIIIVVKKLTRLLSQALKRECSHDALNGKDAIKNDINMYYFKIWVIEFNACLIFIMLFVCGTFFFRDKGI